MKTQKTQKVVFSVCLLRLGVLAFWCCSVCLFVYGPFCHGAIQQDMSTFFFLHITSIYIIKLITFSTFHMKKLMCTVFKHRIHGWRSWQINMFNFIHTFLINDKVSRNEILQRYITLYFVTLFFEVRLQSVHRLFMFKNWHTSRKAWTKTN